MNIKLDVYKTHNHERPQPNKNGFGKKLSLLAPSQYQSIEILTLFLSDSNKVPLTPRIRF
jgi:hypothetical protein